MHTPSHARAPVTLREAIIVVLLLFAGLAMRSWRMSGVTLDHFDEGVYAFSALGISDASQPHRVYPNQEIFSPPVYFGMAGIISRIFQVAPDRALLLLSILFGTLTIAAVWWIVRSGFGVAAGAAAAAFVALSPYHIAFSRSALTDIMFTFWLLLALAALVVAVERGEWRWGILGGLATGLAWNTKYHGWFALLITGASLLPYVWRLHRAGKQWRNGVSAWIVGAVTAFLCYLPWLIYLRTRPGGYEGMATHYLGMLRTAWLHNAIRYGEMLAYFEGPLSRVAVAIAAVLAVALTMQKTGSVRKLAAFAITLIVAAALLGSAGTTLVLTLAAVPLLLRGTVPFRVWVLFATVGLWIVAAPVYRPYARLLLPFAIATAIGAGISLQRAALWLQERTAEQRAWNPQWAILAVFVLAAASLSFAIPSSARLWPRHRGMGSIALAMEQVIPPGSRVIAVIETTPAYYLHRSGRPGFERNGNLAVLDTLSTPAYVITGTYVRKSPRLTKDLAALNSHLTPIETFSVRPYDVRILDDLPPRLARRYRTHPDSTFDLHLWHFQP